MAKTKSILTQFRGVLKDIEKKVKEIRTMSAAFLRTEMAQLRDNIVTKFYSNPTDYTSRSMNGLGRRTGTAARGWRSKVESKKDVLTGRVFTHTPYADHREEKIIKSRGKALAIPISGGKALTPTGRKRYSGPMDSRIRNKLEPIKRKGKPTLLVHKTKGGRRKIDLYYVLVKQVKIPARMKNFDNYVNTRLNRIYMVLFGKIRSKVNG